MPKIDVDNFIRDFMYRVYTLKHDIVHNAKDVIIPECISFDELEKINDALGKTMTVTIIHRFKISLHVNVGYSALDARISFLENYDLIDTAFCKNSIFNGKCESLLQYFCKITHQVSNNLSGEIVGHTLQRLIEAALKNKYLVKPVIMMSTHHSLYGRIRYTYFMKELIKVYWTTDEPMIGVRVIQEWKPQRNNNAHADVIIACVDD